MERPGKYHGSRKACWQAHWLLPAPGRSSRPKPGGRFSCPEVEQRVHLAEHLETRFSCKTSPAETTRLSSHLWGRENHREDDAVVLVLAIWRWHKHGFWWVETFLAPDLKVRVEGEDRCCSHARVQAKQADWSHAHPGFIHIRSSCLQSACKLAANGWLLTPHKTTACHLSTFWFYTCGEWTR